jgi:hypothetical protein
MVENATMIPERTFLEEHRVRFLVRQCSIFWRFWQKMSRNLEGRISRAQSALEQAYQNFCVNSREAGSLPSHQVEYL